MVAEEQEIIDFVNEHYPVFSQNKELIYALVLNHRDKIIVNRNGSIEGVGFFYRLNDAMLGYVRDRIIDINDLADAGILLNQRGDNIHFDFVVAKNFKAKWKGFKETIRRERPKTVSWFSPSMKQFNIKVIKKEIFGSPIIASFMA